MLTAPMKRLLALGAGVALALVSVSGVAAGGASGHAPREILMPPRGAAHGARPVRSSNLSFHGNTPGVVHGADKVFIVYWGAGWATDPSGEASILTSFFGHVGGSGWNNSVTQYCDNVPVGTIFCNGAGNPAANPKANILAGTWYDTTNAAPAHPGQSDLGAEAARAATHFGFPNGLTTSQVQYVIATATGNNASGFGTQYCAWHSSTSSSFGTLGYTNLPYITDAGASCGANFVNSGNAGLTDGITIVEGHEFAETETDIFPSGGWLDKNGAENGDKCAWNSATSNQSLNGGSFPVQPLWSNLSNNGNGACVLSF